MKKFIVLLEYPRVYSQEIEAKNENDLIGKIEAGQYGVLPVHGKEQIKISLNNIKMIYEESFRSQLKDFAIGNTSKTFFKNGIYWRFYGFIMQKIYNLGRWDDKLELLKKSTKS